MYKTNTNDMTLNGVDFSKKVYVIHEDYSIIKNNKPCEKCEGKKGFTHKGDWYVCKSCNGSGESSTIEKIIKVSRVNNNILLNVCRNSHIYVESSHYYAIKGLTNDLNEAIEYANELNVKLGNLYRVTKDAVC